jgi:hypothetical protein
LVAPKLISAIESGSSEDEMEKDSSTSGGGATSERRSYPKRGAIPTPKEVIERAPRYIPESDQANNQPVSQPDSPTPEEEQKGGQGS